MNREAWDSGSRSKWSHKKDDKTRDTGAWKSGVRIKLRINNEKQENVHENKTMNSVSRINSSRQDNI